ncbi:MAG: DUF983 domain-containing protein [Bacteroidetes bacterium]|nr:MAG: DUF983 domain-containing protein [Bacteroidota bacterium]
MAKRSKFIAIWLNKCPRCREGDMFETGSFSFSKPFEMLQGCEKCGQTYYPEPGFYFGSMFISYIITSFFSLAVVGFAMLVLDWSVEAAFGVLIGILAICYVWFFRLARSVWINVTIKYDPEAIDKNMGKGFDNS